MTGRRKLSIILDVNTVSPVAAVWTLPKPQKPHGVSGNIGVACLDMRLVEDTESSSADTRLALSLGLQHDRRGEHIAARASPVIRSAYSMLAGLPPLLM